MENTKSLLESCSKMPMEELGSLSFTKILSGKNEESEFIGLGILDVEGYLLEYNELKKIYEGLNYFIRNVNPELIKKMNSQKQKEDEKQKEKNELIEIVSKNIVDKEDIYEEKGLGFFHYIKAIYRKVMGRDEVS